MRALIPLYCILLASCGSLSKTPKSEKYQLETTLQTLRTDVDTLKNDLHAHQISANVLENRMMAQETRASQLQGHTEELETSTLLSQQKHIHNLEKKLQALEELHAKTYEQLQQQITLVREFQRALAQYKERSYQLENQLATQQTTLSSMLQLRQECLEANAVQGAFAVLFIPYTVKTEDTLEHIAEKYSTTVELIKSFNQLQSDTVSVGRTLLVPQGDMGKASPAEQSP